MCGTKTDGGLVHGLPALVQVASVVDTQAPQAVCPAIVAASSTETPRLLTDSDLASIGLAKEPNLLSARVGHSTARNWSWVIPELVSRLGSQLVHKGLQRIDLVAVSLVHVVTNPHHTGQTHIAQVVHDAFKGSTATRQMACGVVGRLKAVDGHLDRADLGGLEHGRVLPREQVAVGDDACVVGAAALLCKRHQTRGERLYDVWRQERFATKPRHMERFCP